MKLIDMIESQVKSQINTATEEVKREIAYSTKVAKLRKAATASYRLKQPGSSTSYHHLFLDNDNNVAFELKSAIGFKFTCKLHEGNRLIGNITIKKAPHRYGTETIIVSDQKTVGSIFRTKNKLFDSEYFYDIQIPEWEIEEGVDSFIFLHNGDPECVFTFPSLFTKRIDVISNDHLDLIMLMCSAVLITDVARLSSEKAASGG